MGCNAVSRYFCAIRGKAQSKAAVRMGEKSSLVVWAGSIVNDTMHRIESKQSVLQQVLVVIECAAREKQAVGAGKDQGHTILMIIKWHSVRSWLAGPGPTPPTRRACSSNPHKTQSLPRVYSVSRIKEPPFAPSVHYLIYDSCPLRYPSERSSSPVTPSLLTPSWNLI